MSRPSHQLCMEDKAQFNLGDATALLARTPPTLNALLRGLPDSVVRTNEGGESWSPYDIIGHLIAGERTDWIPRARIIIEHGVSRPFPPFDRQAQFKESQDASMDQRLDEFARLREENLAALQALRLQPQDLQRQGTHPAFGAVSFSQLLATWATHDLTHLHQLSRIMAIQYRDAVGPWSAYLGVLHCTGHGS